MTKLLASNKNKYFEIRDNSRNFTPRGVLEKYLFKETYIYFRIILKEILKISYLYKFAMREYPDIMVYIAGVIFLL